MLDDCTQWHDALIMIIRGLSIHCFQRSGWILGCAATRREEDQNFFVLLHPAGTYQRNVMSPINFSKQSRQTVLI